MRSSATQRALGAEAQDRGLVGLAGEDAVSRREVLVELRFGDIFGGLVELNGLAYAVDGKAPQRAAPMVPGIEVPGIPIVGEALG